MRQYNVYILFLVTLLFVGCEKGREEEGLEITTSNSEEVSLAESFYNLVYQISRDEVEQAEEDEELSVNKTDQISALDPCATVSYHVDSINSCITQLTIKYGDTTCNSWGRKKYGKLKVFLTGKINEVGTQMTIIPEGFFINNYRVEGTVKIVNIGFNTDYMYEISKEVVDGKVWLNNNDFFTWNSEEFLEIDFFEELFYYTTSASALSAFGRSYTVETISPLKRSFDCSFVQSGELELKSDWGLHQNINYGDGACDNVAELWQNGSFIKVELD